jgi:hypothetical protein
MTISTEYAAAIAAHNAAIAKYELVRDAYRAGKVSDAVFLKARKEYDDADADFDAAFAAEDARDALEA